MQALLEALLESSEPSIRFKVRVGVMGEDPDSPEIKRLREEIRTSPRVKALLSERNEEGIIPRRVYFKWVGAHWVLPALADLGYPAGDKSLAPLIDQVCQTWLNPKHVDSVPIIEGRARRCASQEANTLYAMIKLGFLDERTDQLAENLLKWQWPDGGWNCDRNPSADSSSFHETWIPLRALAVYGEARKRKDAVAAVQRAAEVFLVRRLFRRVHDGTIIDKRFTKLFYPPYWHYGILHGLRVLSEAGFIDDSRCTEALDLLEDKRLPDGGFPAEAQYGKPIASATSTISLVDWGKRQARKMNEWVTAEALAVLHAAGRLT